MCLVREGGKRDADELLYFALQLAMKRGSMLQVLLPAEVVVDVMCNVAESWVRLFVNHSLGAVGVPKIPELSEK